MYSSYFIADVVLLFKVKNTFLNLLLVWLHDYLLLKVHSSIFYDSFI